MKSASVSLQAAGAASPLPSAALPLHLPGRGAGGVGTQPRRHPCPPAAVGRAPRHPGGGPAQQEPELGADQTASPRLRRPPGGLVRALHARRRPARPPIQRQHRRQRLPLAPDRVTSPSFEIRGWRECVSGGEEQRLTFHTQLQSQVLLHLTEVDPFGNYSSPHYKGTAAFYRVTGDGPPLPPPADDPVCKLSLTLPKVQTKLDFHTKTAT